MIKTLRYNGTDDIVKLLARDGGTAADVDAAVRQIVEAVRQNGDKSVIEYTEKFDGAALNALEIRDFHAAKERIDPELLASLERAAENIRQYHEKQKTSGYIVERGNGVITGQRVTPLERVGIYVPGGTARYPSTVLMNAIPAKLAGVDEIIMVTPPSKDGTVPDSCLAAAAVAGVDRVFKIGGAQAVAALAYGTESVPRVDKIVGPGNIYVATAKRMVYGLVDIDMIAGPSEILVIADDTATPSYVAADLLSQAEHDELSASILVTTSEKLAEAVTLEIQRQLETLPRKNIAERSINDHGAVIIVENLQIAARVSNAIAPEHLELCVADPWGLMPAIRHAGSIFLGHHAPEALGDYFAGPNHTLPTSGTARFSSPLSVDDFFKKSSFIYYDRNALQNAAADITRLARCEGLEAHARSVDVRL